MRLRASVGRLPLSASCSTLRYARHVLFPAPAAIASVWHRLSAPRRPAMLPVVLVALETKKLIAVRDSVGEVAVFPPHAATPAAAIVRTTTAHTRFMRRPPCCESSAARGRRACLLP